MRQTSFRDMHCSIARSLDVIGDWWSPLIVRDIYLGVNRFDDLVEDLGISRNLLTARLRTLIERGILRRSRYLDRPPRYEYELTDAGRTLVPVLLALMAWGDTWQSTPAGPPLLVTDDTTGRTFTPTVVNPDTGVPIDADHITVSPGPGGCDAPGTRVLARRLAATR